MPEVFRYNASARVRQFSSLLTMAVFLLIFLAYAKFIGNKAAIMPIIILICIVVVPGVVAVCLRHSDIKLDDMEISAVAFAKVWRRISWKSVESVELIRNFDHKGVLTGSQVFITETKTGHRIFVSSLLERFTILVTLINKMSGKYGFSLYQLDSGGLQGARGNVVETLEPDPKRAG